MLRAAASFVGGIGVTVASTFASSLGLTVHEQRFGFALGVAMILFAIGLFAYERRDATRRSRQAQIDEGDSEQRLTDAGIPFSDDGVQGDLSFRFTTLVFANNASDSQVISATATVEVVDARGRQVARSHGRWRAHEWSRSAPPSMLIDGAPPAAVSMAPDGAQHRLDVLASATFHPGGLMAQREPNVWQGVYLVRQPRSATLLAGPIPPGQYKMSATLRSEGMPPAVFRYRLRVPFPDGRLNDLHDPNLRPETAWWRRG